MAWTHRVDRQWVCRHRPVASEFIVLLFRTTLPPLHALLNTPACVLTLVLGYGATLGYCVPLSGSSQLDNEDYADSYSLSDGGMLPPPPPEEGGVAPGFRYSFKAVATQKHMYEGVIICLLAVTAFIGLVVWVLKSNFEEGQTRKMRREASLRDKNSNVSPLMTPNSEES